MFKFGLEIFFFFISLLIIFCIVLIGIVNFILVFVLEGEYIVVFILIKCFWLFKRGFFELLGLMDVLVWMIFLIVVFLIDLMFCLMLEMMLFVKVLFKLNGFLIVNMCCLICKVCEINLEMYINI